MVEVHFSWGLMELSSEEDICKNLWGVMMERTHLIYWPHGKPGCHRPHREISFILSSRKKWDTSAREISVWKHFSVQRVDGGQGMKLGEEGPVQMRPQESKQARLVLGWMGTLGSKEKWWTASMFGDGSYLGDTEQATVGYCSLQPQQEASCK